MADIESQARSVENNASRGEGRDLSPEKDADRSTLGATSIENELSKGDGEKIQDSAATQAAGLTACPVGQIGGDDFVEGGFEGWKVVFGHDVPYPAFFGEFSKNTILDIFSLEHPLRH
ncbi:hypothetical protein FRC10_000591 [Ceratobasidium sp. 414]|nr:hypothetical protein FRC10_000591 [Ceratobasidium sp. 414]